MDFSLTAEQQDMAAAVRDLLAEIGGGRPREAALASPADYDPAAWRRMVHELGITGLLVPERFGGLGLSPVDLAVIAQEVGRHVLPTPFLSSAVAATAVLTSCPHPAQARWLPRLAAGEVIGALAVQESPSDYRCRRPASTARTDGGACRITGTKRFVLGAPAADFVLVLAALDATPALFLVDGGAAGMTVEPQTSLDPTLSLSAIHFADTPAIQLVADARAVVGHGQDVLVLAQAAESLGGAEQCLEMAVEYAGTRHQFGRPIGSFQAIKHKCADIFMAIEIARTAVLHAAWALAADPAQARTAVPAAAAESARAFCLAAGENIQIHGGIGFTWEHPAHWYFKRARSYDVLNGTTAEHYTALLSALEPADSDEPRRPELQRTHPA